jgi:hypothetical protein
MLMAVAIDLERLVSRRAPWRKPFPTFGEVKRLKGVGPRRVPLRCYRPTARRPSLTGAGRETQRKDSSPNNLPYPRHGPTAARGYKVGFRSFGRGKVSVVLTNPGPKRYGHVRDFTWGAHKRTAPRHRGEF